MFSKLQFYVSNCRGNMTIAFAAVLFMAIAGIGVAVDYTGMLKLKSQLQDHADSAVLAAAASGVQNQEELQAIAQAMVDANYRGAGSPQVRLEILDDLSLKVTAENQYEMAIMNIFGVNSLPVGVVAEAPPKGGTGLLNIALVLDSTKSMQGRKLRTLKLAANNLVDQLNATSESTTNFSIVPFSRYVKIPLEYNAKSWIEVAPDGEECWKRIDLENSTNCRVVGSGESARNICDEYVYIPICIWREWDGCMGSRQSPWNERAHVGPKKMQGFVRGDKCFNEMLPLSNNVNKAKETIDSLVARHTTYIPAGLIWGWRTLTPDAPFVQAAALADENRNNVMVLMTDGDNFNSMSGDTHWFDGHFHRDRDAASADALTARLCERVKQDGISIYTIAFEVSNSDTKTMLEDCASSSENYFDARNADELLTAFDSVGKSLAQVRLSR